MNDKTFKKVKIMTSSFVSVTVAIAVVNDNITLALAGVVIGVLFLSMVKRTTRKVLVDERVIKISGQAARMTYVILTILLGLLSIIFISSGVRTGELYIEALGTVLSYITLLSVAIYAMSYKFFEKKHGGDK